MNSQAPDRPLIQPASAFLLLPVALRILLAAIVCVGGLLGPARGPALAQGPISLTVAITPVYYDAVPILYALKTGMFEKVGLDVHLQRIGSPAVIGAAVASGTVDIGKATTVSLMQGFARGLPFRLIAPGAMYDDRQANAEFLVAKDSPIHSAKDLNGQTIATQTLGALDQVAFDAWLGRNGGDPSTLHWVEIPMTAGAAAIEEGRAVGESFTSPLLDNALATGKFRILAPIFSAIAPRFLFTAYFTTTDWAANHPDVIRKFAAVIREAGEYTNTHHDDVAPLVADMASQTVAVMMKTQWAIAGTALQPSDLQPLIDQCAKYGVLTTKSFPAASTMIQ